ncbi:hypothetical protein BGZ88_001442 [Linnemannia elongata]|nr:hypothetical protein BGZ88_001442 [Linnemannia elongata]
MAVLTFNSNPSTATRHNLSRRQHDISGSSIHSGGSRQQQPAASRPDIGLGSTTTSKAEWGLHDLDDHIEVSGDDLNPSRKRTTKRRTLRRGFIGVFLIALSIIALWTRYSSHRSVPSTTGSFDDTSDDDYWRYDSDKTTLPSRSYPPDEKYFILEYSPWLGFNNMRGEGEDADMGSKENKLDSRNGREMVLKTVQRRSWDLAGDPSLSIINNIIRNGLVDTLDEAKGDHLSQQSQVQEDGSVHVNRSFYAFADVQGGGFGRIVNWSVQFQYKNNEDKAQDPATTAQQRHSKGRPLLDTCRPPLEDPSADQIPWQSRFPGFATCRIQNYVGLAQELGQIDADVLVVEGQFHTAGWIPMAHSSLETAKKHRQMALTYLRYSPVVHEAADYLMERLKARILRRGGSGNVEKGGDFWLRLSMHVRRGDFVSQKHGWQNFDDGWMGSLVKDAVESVFGPLDPSLNLSSPIPGTVSEVDEGSADNSSQDNNDNNNNGQTSSRSQPSPINIPEFGFYMSTDETSPQILSYFQSLGAILFEDLLDPYFESRFGHLIIFDDWIGLVEQLICARAAMFVGTMSSSFTSGILNLRLDPEAVGEEGGERDSGRKTFEYLYRKGGPVLTPEQQKQG